MHVMIGLYAPRINQPAGVLTGRRKLITFEAHEADCERRTGDGRRVNLFPLEVCDRRRTDGKETTVRNDVGRSTPDVTVSI